MNRFMQWVVFVLITLLLIPSAAILHAQTSFGEIRGRLTDSRTHAPLDYTTISLTRNGQLRATAMTDDSGLYIFMNVPPATYDLSAASLGYKKVTITCVEVKAKKITFQDIRIDINAGGTELADVVIVRKKPLIEPDRMGSNISAKTISRAPTKSINMIANTVQGVESRRGSPSFRGARAEGTAYYIDGIRVSGAPTRNAVTVPVKVQNDESYAYTNENEFKSVKSDPLSTFSIDVDKASYAIVRRYLNSREVPPVDAVRIEEMINYFPYEMPEVTGSVPFSLTTEIVPSPWKKEAKIVHITLQAKKIAQEKAPDNNLVFLIDVSGSMMSEDKLPLLKNCLHMLLNTLRPQDKVAIVVYAGSSGLVLDATHGDEKDKIAKALDGLEAGGSTAGGAGIELAYETASKNFITGGNNRVILATDGDFNVGITDQSALIRLIEEKRATGIYLSVLGFGTGNYKDATMEQLADKGNGNYAYIDNLMEGNKVLVKEVGGTLYTVAKDVKIQIEFNPSHVKSYRLIGYENRLLNNEDFNNDKKDAGDLGAGHCVTAIYELVTKEDPATANVDPLKYQQANTSAQSNADEMMTVKVRYKEPKEIFSKKIEVVVKNSEQTLEKASNNLRFAVAVASFGMKLRASKFATHISYPDIVQMAKESKGKDEEGYRAEFIRLIETRDLIASK